MSQSDIDARARTALAAGASLDAFAAAMLRAGASFEAAYRAWKGALTRASQA